MIDDLLARINTVDETVNDVADGVIDLEGRFASFGSSYENFLSRYADEMEAVDDSVKAVNQSVSDHKVSTDAHNDIRSLIDGLKSSKVSVTDIVNNLTSTDTNKPLSAAQGKALKGLIDGIDVSGGIHVGSGTPPTGATVWIDPAGTAYALYNGEVETV